MRQAVITFGGRRRRPGLCPRRGVALRLAGLLLAGLCTWQAALASEPAKLVLGTDVDEQIYTRLFERLVYAEAFKRLGVHLEIVVAPLKRLEMQLERGEIDGETMRGPAYADAYPKFIQVDFPIMRAANALYALKPMEGLQSLQDLRSSPLHGAYRRGVLFCQSVLEPLLPKAQLTNVTTVRQAMDMLAAGHADFFCDVSLGVLNYEYEAKTSPAPKPIKLFEIGKQVPITAYLHARHAAFAPKLAATLKLMESEGLFEKYRLETAIRLQRP